MMMREIAHQKSFEKALFAIGPNFPPGKLPGMEQFASVYVNASQGPGDSTGPWNSGDEWTRIDDLENVLLADGGDGMPTVSLGSNDKSALSRLEERNRSDPNGNPTTGADLGAGPGAGRTKPVPETA